MSVGRSYLYLDYYNAFKIRFKDQYRNGTECQQACNAIWKKSAPETRMAMMNEWKADIVAAGGSLEPDNAARKQSQRKKKPTAQWNPEDLLPPPDSQMTDITQPDDEDSMSPSPPLDSSRKRASKKRKKPAQEKLEREIKDLKEQIFVFYQMEQQRVLTTEEVEKRINLVEQLKPLEKRLEQLKAYARRSIKAREKEKKILGEILLRAKLSDDHVATTSKSPSPKPTKFTPPKPKPAQEKIEHEIDIIQSTIRAYDEMQRKGKIEEMQKRSREGLVIKLETLRKKIKKLKKAAEINQTRRKVRKKMLMNLLTDPQNIELAGIKKFRDSTGRPSLEDEQPGLKSAIFEIVGVPETGNDVVIHTIHMSLGELQKELKERGFVISKSSLCYRFHPSNNSESVDSKRKRSLPFRLMKPAHPPKNAAPPPPLPIPPPKQIMPPHQPQPQQHLQHQPHQIQVFQLQEMDHMIPNTISWPLPPQNHYPTFNQQYDQMKHLENMANYPPPF